MNILNAEIRSPNLKAKQVRKKGLIPGCIYGPKLVESLSIQLNQSDVTQLLRKKSKGNIMEININGERMVALLDEVSMNTLKHEVEHISFHALDLEQKVLCSANIILNNKEKVSGLIEQVMYEIPYKAFPADIVDSITIELEGRQSGDKITVADVEFPNQDKIELAVNEDSMILKLVDKKLAAV